MGILQKDEYAERRARFPASLLIIDEGKAGSFRKERATRRAGGVLRIGPLPSSAYQRAAQIAGSHIPRLGTRTLDVLHVAAALALKADTFCTFDAKQAKLASALGLRIL